MGSPQEKAREKGVGWVWARMLATIGPTVVIARAWPGDRDATNDALRGLPTGQRPEVIWVDLPKWASLWHRVGTTHMQRVEYLLWQAMALREARRLHRRSPFDLAWHLTWANVWMGSTASLLGVPFVYGPVGGGVGPPMASGSRARSEGHARGGPSGRTRKLARIREPARRAPVGDARASCSSRTPRRESGSPPVARSKVVIFPNAVFDHDFPPATPRRDRPPTALFAGRLVPWKGAALAVRAIALCPGWRLVVCGEGPQLDRLRRLTQELGIEGQVELRGWQPRDGTVSDPSRGD